MCVMMSLCLPNSRNGKAKKCCNRNETLQKNEIESLLFLFHLTMVHQQIT